MKRISTPILPAMLLIVSGCASSGVDFDESARLMGREGDVRIDAQISSPEVRLGSNLALTYEIENLREQPIAVADIIPEVMYDTESGIVTILLGSEVPGNQFLPRLELIRSGERKSFTAGANLAIGSTARTSPQSVRIRLAYLKSVEPFQELIGITQKTVHDPERADALFLPWVENLQSVTTNEIPLHWTRRSDDGAASSGSGRNVRRPRSPGSPF